MLNDKEKLNILIKFDFNKTWVVDKNREQIFKYVSDNLKKLWGNSVNTYLEKDFLEENIDIVFFISYQVPEKDKLEELLSAIREEVLLIECGVPFFYESMKRYNVIGAYSFDKYSLTSIYKLIKEELNPIGIIPLKRFKEGLL